jgi:hypothetical protein
MAGLAGKIYTLSGHVGGARTPHPHLVAVEFSDRCWLRPDQAFVEIDNSLHVTFYDGRPPHEAVWVVERIDRWPKEELSRNRPIGEMNGAGLLLILGALLALMDAKPDLYSAPMRRRVSRMADELRLQTGTG